MADRNLPTKTTITEFRTTFNNLGSDVGDISTLSGDYSSTDLIDAIGEEKTATHPVTEDDILALTVALSD